MLSTLLLLASELIPRLRPGLPIWVYLACRTSAFLLLTFLVQGMLGSPLHPGFDVVHRGRQLWQQLIEAGWWLLAGQVAAELARTLIVLEHRPRETRIVSDLLAGVIYVATALAIVSFAFSVPVGGLLATSGVIAIVLGLALQSTLSDVFSGIAVGLERPYKPGDLIWVEGGIEGQVIQVNWRSTQIATSQSNIAVVPNSIIAKARLVNRSAPTLRRGDTIEVALDPRAVPEHCLATLGAAITACRISLPEPAPTIACIGLHGDGVTYEIGFTVAVGSMLPAARTEIFFQVHRHLLHAGIALAVPGARTAPQTVPPSLGQMLQRSELFGVIDAAPRAHLVEHFTELFLQPGETLIRQGQSSEALFLLASGTAEITVLDPNTDRSKERVVYRVSPGEALGAVGLITGTPYGATATALTPLRAWRLGKSDIAAAINAEPSLATSLEALAQRGLAAMRRDVTAHDEARRDHPDVLLTKLRNFLRLLNS